MAGAYANLFTSAVVTGSVGNWKGVISYTAPGDTAVRMPRPTIDFTATASNTPTNRVRVTIGATGQVGAACLPVEAHDANPPGVALGTGKENLSNMGSGGRFVREYEFKGFGSFVIPLMPNMLIAPGETIQIDCNVGAACNINAGWDGIEI